ncbi:response regulator transcription factor [Fangia hongkongensis]|uniref:response regulator transcription factor n=2 Tax=Fangia hongkongensis TaxID=270495 RepID=UPI00035DC205|nr:response regulator transcription factor [Fangia hongkongensis]
MDKKRVLIIDDDKEIGALLSEFLSNFHYEVIYFLDGDQAIKAMKNSLFDIVLLDIMLPNTNGFELCKILRESYDVPIIIISALDQDSDRILGLEVGADDYLPKPFNTRELLARMKALLRRANGHMIKGSSTRHMVHFEKWKLDRHRHVLVDQNEITIALSAKEYRLLEIFLAHPNQILTRDQIMEHLYDRDFDPFDRTVDVLIGRLRKKIEVDLKSPKLLKTVRGEGYQFCVSKHDVG